MRTFPWPTEDGWPYPDSTFDVIDPGAETDDDLLDAANPHLFDRLDPLERQVIGARFGVGGTPQQSMKQLLATTGLPRADLRAAMGSGLAKLRAQLT